MPKKAAAPRKRLRNAYRTTDDKDEDCADCLRGKCVQTVEEYEDEDGELLEVHIRHESLHLIN